jgi:hypothetical protein
VSLLTANTLLGWAGGNGDLFVFEHG